MDSHAVIETLPVTGELRAALIEIANRVFEKVVDRIEPENESLTRKLWDPDDYIDNHFFKEGMLPMNLDYADYLIDSFLMHHIVDLAVEADRRAERH
ncbi:hypothetical protein HFO24_06585 [Rhizobium laguerreae]|uniref:hypothetical protein n=1 Tax=Rhizobium laguerreae TaxID=1076926 RepID=UPI001C90A67E|nr:hypothetical protein [Rhizobium laguerreae]MBY3181336.1 hypothetical protein [Rhizobium laguerreae]